MSLMTLIAEHKAALADFDKEGDETCVSDATAARFSAAQDALIGHECDGEERIELCKYIGANGDLVTLLLDHHQGLME